MAAVATVLAVVVTALVAADVAITMAATGLAAAMTVSEAEIALVAVTGSAVAAIVIAILAPADR